MSRPSFVRIIFPIAGTIEYFGGKTRSNLKFEKFQRGTIPILATNKTHIFVLYIFDNKHSLKSCTCATTPVCPKAGLKARVWTWIGSSDGAVVSATSGCGCPPPPLLREVAAFAVTDTGAIIPLPYWGADASEVTDASDLLQIQLHLQLRQLM